MGQSDDLNRLLDRANQLGILRRGQFKLASGQTSGYYIDGRQLSLDGQGADLIGRIILDRLDRQTRSIGGPATGAIPIIAATVVAASQSERLLTGFYSRSKAKNYGLGQQIEGRVESPVVLVDDVCTTGESLAELAKQLEGQGKVIGQIITVFDRGGGRAVRAGGYHYSSLLTVRRKQLVVGD